MLSSLSRPDKKQVILLLLNLFIYLFLIVGFFIFFVVNISFEDLVLSIIKIGKYKSEEAFRGITYLIRNVG
jgi:hypothetical protein